jgi:hypothetical protein
MLNASPANTRVLLLRAAITADVVPKLKTCRAESQRHGIGQGLRTDTARYPRHRRR